MSAVQIALLTAHMARSAEADSDDRLQDFETQLLVTNPVMYERWLQLKESRSQATYVDDDIEDLPVDGVEWRFPESPEEIAEIEQELMRQWQETHGSDAWTEADGSEFLDEMQD